MLARLLGHARAMSHLASKALRADRSPARPGQLPSDLCGYLRVEPWPRVGRPKRHDPREWRITDDLPRSFPVTSQEVDASETWFDDLFDKLFGGRL